MTQTQKIFAEDLPYWKTSNLGLDSSMTRIVKEITKAEGRVTGKAVVESENQAFILIEFYFGADQFKVDWYALPSKKGDRRAALIQAAHEIFRRMLRKTAGNSKPLHQRRPGKSRETVRQYSGAGPLSKVKNRDTGPG